MEANNFIALKLMSCNAASENCAKHFESYYNDNDNFNAILSFSRGGNESASSFHCDVFYILLPKNSVRDTCIKV